MEINKLTIDQRLQIARMATDIVVEGIRTKQPVGGFTDKSTILRTDHDLFMFVYHAIEEVVTGESDTE